MKLTKEHVQILHELTLVRRGLFVSARWVAGGCGHFNDAAWASSRMRSLIAGGLVEKRGPAKYRITEAGRAALEAENG